MAERLALSYLVRLRAAGFVTSSAGTHALAGHPIEPHAARIVEKLGGDASDFLSQRLTPKIVNDADLVLTMTTAHRDDVLKVAPRQLNRTFTLSEAAQLVLQCGATNVADLAACRPELAANLLTDVPDPIGQDEGFFAEIGAQIYNLLPPVLDLCQRG